MDFQFIVADREMLRSFDPREVLIRRWKAPRSWQYYKDVVKEHNVTLCQYCNEVSSRCHGGGDGGGVCACLRACVCACMHVCVHACVRACVCVCVCVSNVSFLVSNFFLCALCPIQFFSMDEYCVNVLEKQCCPYCRHTVNVDEPVPITRY